MIIDCHCHAGPGDGLTGPWDSSVTLPTYLARARESGIGHTVVFPVFHTDYALANRAVARIVRASGGRLSGFAFLHAQRDAGRIHTLVETAVRSHGFLGLKVHRHDARISAEICEAAHRFGLPVLYDVMGEVAPVELLATQYPEVDFIIPHLGSFADDWRAQIQLIDHLERHANIYTDTSGMRRFDMLEQALARAGASKILFGSDGPWLHPGVELAKVRALGLSKHEERQVLGGNFMRLVKAARIRRDSGGIERRPGQRRRPPDRRTNGFVREVMRGAADITADSARHDSDPWMGEAAIP
jgi:predicted TIM-barrel fold metal-dependent hydrolase